MREGGCTVQQCCVQYWAFVDGLTLGRQVPGGRVQSWWWRQDVGGIVLAVAVQ